MIDVKRWCVLALVAAGCAREAAPVRGPDTAQAAAIAWAFDAPRSWDDRVTLGDARNVPGTYRSARLFTYAPRDTTIVPQVLLGIFVYDSAAWVGLSADPGPPLGDSLTSANGHVFIASLPQSNPFREGSADARTFDSMTVDLAAVRRGFRVLRR